MLGVRLAVAGAIAVFILAGKVSSKTCENGFSCSPPKDCCPQGPGCCYLGMPHAGSPYLPSGHGPVNVLSAVFWNHWFFWSLLALLLLSCSGGCSLWRRRHELDPLGCCGLGAAEDAAAQADRADRDSTASCYPPPQYSRCNSFSQPPPYSEVTSKPDLYPLVISYNDNSAKGGSYLMVQYLRHYFLRPTGGSLSHTSTAESLSSSFVCGTAEALAGLPPRYVAVAEAEGSGPPSAALPTPPPLPSSPSWPRPTGRTPALPAPPSRRPLPNSASMPSVGSLTSSRFSSRSGSRSGSRTGSRSQTQSYGCAGYTHSMVVGEWSNSGSVSVSVQAVRGGPLAGLPGRPASLPQQPQAGCSGTVSEVSSLLGEVSPSSPPRALSPSAPHELRLLLEQIDSLTGAGATAGPAHQGAPLAARPAAWTPWTAATRARRGYVTCRTSRSAPCTPLSPVGPTGPVAAPVDAQPAVFQAMQSEDPPSPAPLDPPLVATSALRTPSPSSTRPLPPRRTLSASLTPGPSASSRLPNSDWQAHTPLLQQDEDLSDAPL